MVINCCALCLHVSWHTNDDFEKKKKQHWTWYYLSNHAFCLTCSGFDEIMPAHRIRAVLGLHAISEFKNKNNINQINTAYEIELRNIVVHPEYACKRPYNDIGSRKRKQKNPNTS